MKGLYILLFSLLMCFASLFKSESSGAQCTDSLWSHVYHSYRLFTHDSCMAVSGKIFSLIYEADGDIHIRLTVDSPYTYLLNAVNYSGQYGKLVCEPLCATTCTQADAIASCAGFVNTVYIPAVGEHVIVRGSYVTDNDHGWNELHPVTSITVGYLYAPANIQPDNLPALNIYPNPAKTYMKFSLSEKPSSPVYITISDAIGRLAGQYQLFETTELEVNTRFLPSGKYYYHANKDEKHLSSGSFIVIK